jgi:integrase
MRHTAASWAVQAGVPDYEVARLLGHSSTRIVSTYAHL